MSSALYGLTGRQSFMPETTTSGDTIFDSEENLEEEQEATGRQPLFSSPGDQIAAWMEQDREGNWYISCQVNFFGQSFNVPLFVNDERDDARQYINKVGQALSE
jgi:hypothetical protein